MTSGSAVVLESYNDLAAASAVQQRFMQHRNRALETVRYDAQCRQLCELGGDCYDFIPLPDGRLAFAIADASGKGLAAALAILGLQSSLRTAVAFTDGDPRTVVSAVNRQVHASSVAGRYATLFFGVFDEATCTLRYVNAGHNPPIIIGRGGSIVHLDAGGLPVGLFADLSYTEAVAQLYPGDLIVAYTDGVTEATNHHDEEFGIERLIQAAIHNARPGAEKVVQAVFEYMDRFTGGRQNDDATVLVLQIP